MVDVVEDSCKNNDSTCISVMPSSLLLSDENNLVVSFADGVASNFLETSPYTGEPRKCMTFSL